MKYALLIYDTPDNAVSDEEAAEYVALRQATGVYDGAHLQPVHATTTVRVQDGQTLTTDGPFADTKEFIGGYYLFEADDLDAAIELAGRIPAARSGGAVEIRPIVERPS
jgi:hypothetical protein